MMRISLVGGYGYTGKLICKELNKTKYSYSIYGRNIDKLDQLSKEESNILNSKEIDLRRIEDVKFITENSDIIINCAGPFTEESFLLVENAAISGKIYLDISGEIGFVKKSYDRLHAISKKNNALIIHSCAFESLVSDLLLHYLNEENEIKTVQTFYKFNQKKVSPGTRLTMKLNKFRRSLKIQNNKWMDCDFKKDHLQTLFENDKEVAIPYSLPEVAFSKWNFDVSKAESFLIVEKNESKFLMNNKFVEGDSLKELDRLRLKTYKGPEAKNRIEQKCKIFVNINQGYQNSKTLQADVKDMYLFTAKAIVQTLEKIIENKMKMTGLISPGQIFSKDILTSIKNLNIKLNLQSKFKIDD
tara:strand:+ start:500 stop:1573 length:1074 start_codon:yes stop_codon:yes gene_type:complete